MQHRRQDLQRRQIAVALLLWGWLGHGGLFQAGGGVCGLNLDFVAAAWPRVVGHGRLWSGLASRRALATAVTAPLGNGRLPPPGSINSLPPPRSLRPPCPTPPPPIASKSSVILPPQFFPGPTANRAANCAFLYATKVELITYHRSVPDPLFPHITQRQYRALILRAVTCCDLADRILLRTSEYAPTSDAALYALADEIEGLVGARIGDRDACWPTRVSTESQPEYSSDGNYYDEHEHENDCDIELALVAESDDEDDPENDIAEAEAESALAYEAQARFDAEILADLESAIAEAEAEVLPELALAWDIQLALEVEEALALEAEEALALEAEKAFALEAAAARACFDEEMLGDFEPPSSAQVDPYAYQAISKAPTLSNVETAAGNKPKRGRKRTRRESVDPPEDDLFIHVKPGMKPPPGHIEFELEHVHGSTKARKRAR